MDFKPIFIFLVIEYGTADGGKKSFNTCGRPLDKDGCPRTDNHKSFRQQCMNGFHGCPPNTHYICGEDEATGNIVEACHDIYRCPAGYYVALRLHKSRVRPYCKKCDEKHFQNVPSDSSSGSLEGCTQPRSNDAIRYALKSGSLVRYSIGWPSAEDVFRCNSDQGWSNQNRVLDCTTSSPCYCVKKVKCESETKPYLVADGSCIGCEEKQKENPKFKCDRKNSTEDDLDISSNSTTLVTDADGNSIAFIVGLAIGCIVFGAFVVVVSDMLLFDFNLEILFQFMNKLKGSDKWKYVFFCLRRCHRPRRKRKETSDMEVPVQNNIIKNTWYISGHMVVGENAYQNVYGGDRENERGPSTSSSTSATSSPAEDQKPEQCMENLKQSNSQSLAHSQYADPTQPHTDADNDEYENHDKTKVKQLNNDEEETLLKH